MLSIKLLKSLLEFKVCKGQPLLADLTVSKRPGTSYQIEIDFAVVNHLYLLFSFVKLVET